MRQPTGQYCEYSHGNFGVVSSKGGAPYSAQARRLPKRCCWRLSPLSRGGGGRASIIRTMLQFCQTSGTRKWVKLVGFSVGNGRNGHKDSLGETDYAASKTRSATTRCRCGPTQAGATELPNGLRKPPPALLRSPGNTPTTSSGQLTSVHFDGAGHSDGVVCHCQHAGLCRRVPQPFRWPPQPAAATAHQRNGDSFGVALI